VDSGDYKPEDYRVMQSEGYRKRLGEMRQCLGFGRDVDTFKNIVNGFPAGESLYRTYRLCFLAISYQFLLIIYLTVQFFLVLYVALS